MKTDMNEEEIRRVSGKKRSSSRIPIVPKRFLQMWKMIFVLIMPQTDANVLPDFIIVNTKLSLFFFYIFISWGFLSIRSTSSLLNYLSSQRTEENIYIYRDIIL